MKKITPLFLLEILLCLAGLPLSGQEMPTIKITTSLEPDGENTICIWPVSTSGRIWVTGATLLDEEYLDGEPNYYTITSQEITIKGDVTYLNIDDNHLTSIDLSGNGYLRSLFCANNELTEIDLSNSGYMQTFDGHGNRFEKLDFSQNKKMRIVSIDRNNIRGENMTSTLMSLPDQTQEVGEVKIWVIDTKAEEEKNVCTKEQVAILKAKNFQVLDWAGGANNRKGIPYEGSQTTNITLKTALPIGSPITINLGMDDENITLTGVEEEYLEGDYDEFGHSYTLTSQEVTISGDITELDCNGQELTELHIENLPHLWYLAVYNNQLTTFEIRECPAVEEIYISANKLSSLHLDNLPELYSIDCSGNQLTSLILEGCENLSSLWCHVNQLQSLDLNQIPSLSELMLGHNDVEELDLSQNYDIKTLNVSNNRIKQLDFSHNPKLKTILCYTNAIKGENMTAMMNSLPFCQEGLEGKITVVDTNSGQEENICYTTDVAIAKEKNWICYDYCGSISDTQEYPGAATEVEPVLSVEDIDYSYDPSSGIVRILCDARLQWRLCSLSGEFLLSGDSQLIDMKDYNRGIYLLTISSVGNKSSVILLHK